MAGQVVRRHGVLGFEPPFPCGQVDEDMNGMKERTLQLQQTSVASREKSAHAQAPAPR